MLKAIQRSLPGQMSLSAKLFYYGCDGEDDHGWGCGFRCLQTLESCYHFDVPTLQQAIDALGCKRGFFADTGDILTYFNKRYGWTSELLQVNTESDIDDLLVKLDSYLSHPQRRYAWGVMCGGGITLLVCAVDLPGRRLQLFDPHGPPGPDESGNAQLTTAGHGGYGWLDIESLLIGSAEPDVSSIMTRVELLQAMGWVVAVMDTQGGGSDGGKKREEEVQGTGATS